MNLSKIHSPKTPFLDTATPEEKRQEIKYYFLKTYELYESLFDVIKNEKSYYSKPEPLRHPLIFYFGHTAVFFINKLLISKNISQRINPKLESIFAIGVDEMTWDDLDEKNYEWPSLKETHKYRQDVKDRVLKFIDEMPISLPISQDDPAWVILMGIEHERIHLETTSVIIRQLPLEEVQNNKNWNICPHQSSSFPNNSLLRVSGKPLKLGKTDSTYGWDSEYGTYETHVENFEASQMLVSNGEFFEFIKEGGYENFEYWTEEGQKWLQSTSAQMPRFWRSSDGQYFLRNMVEEIVMPWNWPVEINYYEAKAFCQWKSQKENSHFRLPTEAEWFLLRENINGDITDWNHAPGNINLEHFASSAPVDHFNQGDFFDIIGNVWQWTETPIDGYQGFEVHPVYDDFSVPTFDGDHHLIKGGSWISTGNEALKSARYAFRKHFYQHAGFRYIKAPEIKITFTGKNMYETDELVSQYLEFHYGQEYFETPNFPKACVKACFEEMDKETPLNKALDLGCAVGRSTFELAQRFKAVVGIDFTARFIEKAVQLQKEGHLRYAIPTEGKLMDFKETQLSQLELESNKEGIEFWQGDACNLKSQFKDFDLIFCGNLIDRLYEPKKFLLDMSHRINKGGYLILTSPYTWLEEFTDKDKWIGGYKKDGENQETLEGLKEILSKDFEFVSRRDIPFVIRETRRKHQHTVSEMSIWRKV